MKITKEYLRRVIKEELSRTLNEGEAPIEYITVIKDVVLGAESGTAGTFRVPPGKYFIFQGDGEARLRLVTAPSDMTQPQQLGNEFDKSWLEKQKAAGTIKQG
jgi:hypothetical protein